MGYYIGINTGDLEDTVEDYIIKNSLDGDPDDLWSQNGWGFFEELSTITYDNEAYNGGHRVSAEVFIDAIKNMAGVLH